MTKSFDDALRDALAAPTDQSPVDRSSNEANAIAKQRTARDELDSDAAVRFGHLFHLISDAVVEIELLEYDPIVRSVNPGFETIFGYDREDVLGESLNDFIVPADATDATAFDERTAAGKENAAIVRRKTATGVREFLYRGVPYQRSDGRPFGFAIYSDITEQRRYERHSRVIHRILRHNLRNDLSVIMAAANHIESTATSVEIRTQAEKISDHARRLGTLRQETRALERVLDETGTVATDVTDVCRKAVTATDLAEPDTVRVDIPDDLTVIAVQQLQAALEALVDNALTHAGDEPTVTVRARCGSDNGTETVAIEVMDDGPGIPEQERAPVFDDRDITQLEHGSGLGLWLARWTAESSGGDIEYERVDGHTIVRLVLRAGDTMDDVHG